MPATHIDFALFILIVGVVIISASFAKSALARIKLPAVPGYILIGLILSLVNFQLDIFDSNLSQSIDLLAQIGIVVLLFRIGLESDLMALKRQFSRAVLIWFPNMIIPALLGFGLIAVFYPEFGMVAALFVGAALSATSIGVSAAVWDELGALNSNLGALLLDVAELDDISAVILLSLIFALSPALESSEIGISYFDVLVEIVFLVIKLVVFCGACYLFSRLVERSLTRFFLRLDVKFGPLLFAVGTGFIIAALADFIGLSLAIGALFAGLAFSRDPVEMEIDQAFSSVYALFSPFFFVAIGLSLDPSSLVGFIGLGMILLVVAIAGKVLGAGLPANFVVGPHQGLLFGFSMVPRAEIALIIMQFGLMLGSWAVPQKLYSAMVLVSLATCILAPITVRILMARTTLDVIE